MAKKQTKQDEQLENVQDALSTSGRWIEKNQNLLTWIVLGILALAVVVMLINNYVVKPHRAAADEENAIAMTYFMQNNYEVALNGNENDCMGFAAIADKYNNKAGDLAAYCAGVCCYQMGNFEDAIDYLKGFSTDEVNFQAASEQLLGDAYVQTEDFAKAAACFEKVGAMNHAVLSPMSLMKAARAYKALGQEDKAIKAYKAVKDNYPMSEEAAEAEKYIY